jgi:hypothetical protein
VHLILGSSVVRNFRSLYLKSVYWRLCQFLFCCFLSRRNSEGGGFSPPPGYIPLYSISLYYIGILEN